MEILEKPFGCSVCRMSFTLSKTLKEHVLRVHLQNKVESNLTSITSNEKASIHYKNVNTKKAKELENFRDTERDIQQEFMDENNVNHKSTHTVLLI